jgi:hypothetical protein
MSNPPRKNSSPKRSQTPRTKHPGTSAAETVAPAPRAARRPESVRQRKESRQKAIQRQQRQRQLTRIGLGAIGAVVVVALLWMLVDRLRTPDVSADVTNYFSAEDFVGVHPQDDNVILYEQIPPVGGPHNNIWQNCGFYDKYIFNWHGVHALEHGAVWLTYDPNLSQEDKDKLESLTEQGYVIASPYPGLDAPVIGSVWGKQMKFDGVNDDRIEAFIEQYRRNPNNSPEPNAICWNGTSITTDQEPQQEPYRQADASLPPIGGLRSIDATATAAAQQEPASTPLPVSSPAASPQATPAASPKATPETSATTPAS